MIGLSFQFDDRTPRVQSAARKGSFRNLGHAAAAISKDAKANIETSDEPSAVGEPPHTQARPAPEGHPLRRGQGPRGGRDRPAGVDGGRVGAAHELGEEFRGEDFDERPFMLPALEDNLDRFAGGMAGSLGE